MWLLSTSHLRLNNLISLLLPVVNVAGDQATNHGEHGRLGASCIVVIGHCGEKIGADACCKPENAHAAGADLTLKNEASEELSQSVDSKLREAMIDIEGEQQSVPLVGIFDAPGHPHTEPLQRLFPVTPQHVLCEAFLVLERLSVEQRS